MIAEAREDVIIAFISSRLTNLTDSCILINDENPGYKATGLKTASILRLDKVATIARDLLMGEIGEVIGPLRDEINKKLSRDISTLGYPDGLKRDKYLPNPQDPSGTR
jgi:mRNA interferase MazF